MDGKRFEKIAILDSMMKDEIVEKLKNLGRDLWEEPAMLILVKGFFKDEEWISYLSTKIDKDELLKEFRKKIGHHFKVIDVVNTGPFDVAAVVDFENTPDEEELSKLMDHIEEDVVDFLLGPKYLGRIKEQVDIFTDPFKSLVDFSIGHAFIRKPDEDGIISALNIAFKDTSVRKSVKMSRLTEELLRILDRQDLESYFQPIVDVKDRKALAYEALIRGSKGSLLRRPDILFKVASLNSLEMELDKLARRKHLEKFKKYLSREKSEPAILTINLGPQTPMFVDEIDKDAERYGIPPGSIVWEISERTYIDDFAAFVRVVNYLSEKGHRVAIDDFGSGATSLKLTFSIKSNFVKIDKELVTDIEERKDKQVFLYNIIRSFYDPAGALVVEGVETKEELDTLMKIGYRYYQGFYFFRPSPEIPDDESITKKLSAIDTESARIFNGYYNI